MKRYECLQAIAPAFTDEIVVGSVGGVRPEWHSLWGHGTNFYMVNMGMASSIALGLALQLPHRRVVVFDGDGSLLFNLGCLATIGNTKPSNLLQIVFDNGIYESSGGGATAASGDINLAQIAQGAGIKNAFLVTTVAEFEQCVRDAFRQPQLTFICAKVEPGMGPVKALPFDPLELKFHFIRKIEASENISILDLPEL
jgi:thiamine pyrophosphate-dependent acetolactate synthase large subunit-like protein